MSHLVQSRGDEVAAERLTTMDKGYKSIPLYRENYETAFQRDETAEWRESINANRACSEAIADAISNASTSAPYGVHFEADKALEQAASIHSLERIALVTVHQMIPNENRINSIDGRYSKDVQEWAKSKVSQSENFCFDNFKYCNFSDKSHPVIVNSFAKEVIAMENEFEKHIESDIENAVVEDVQREMDEENAQKLYDKISTEFSKFVSAMKTLPVDNIIMSAYEIAVKNNIFNFCQEGSTELTSQQFKALLSSRNTLDEVYEQWCNNGELHSYNDIGCALKETADRIQMALDRVYDMER